MIYGTVERSYVTYRAGAVGTGGPGGDGYAIACRHTTGCARTAARDPVACADTVRERTRRGTIEDNPPTSTVESGDLEVAAN